MTAPHRPQHQRTGTNRSRIVIHRCPDGTDAAIEIEPLRGGPDFQATTYVNAEIRLWTRATTADLALDKAEALIDERHPRKPENNGNEPAPGQGQY